MTASLARYQGCLIGGAIGDALGAPIEFLSLAQIQTQFGPAGVRDFAPAYGRRGAITDDTQMSLFTAEGLLRAWARMHDRGLFSPVAVVGRAYLRWLYTQGHDAFENPRDKEGWLLELPELHHRRAHGNTCLSALLSTPWGKPARNDSKGCGGVMRAAPAGLFIASTSKPERWIEEAFELGCQIAALTHGHPTGQLTAGVLASLVLQLVGGSRLRDALAVSMDFLADRPECDETLSALKAAIELAERDADADISLLGEGWIAEEALAMGVFAALTAADFGQGVLRAVNHGGDSDSTGSIAGNLLGAALGMEAIPTRWREEVELGAAVLEIANDLHACEGWGCADGHASLLGIIASRYPPS
ncbi:ADP-ribosylglycohydrolase family protein [uncultured Aquimonas sp.]|uniref:ADP-ribosylglycohydrolase family protein n=1 Tax=uncultured Aquimonas sp. TaxID=385483 RepID=UPI00086AB55A|nr:ADP-ribosylglycohydrolase family protein [uncultured Aquimonas sp.]ODU43378.1 MAG: hypothetical protein ABS96_23475 [Xanthomonadaceae bacterium SCN 69-123]